MTKTIQTALAPLLIIGSFCNLGLFEYPFGQSRPYLTCLYILSTWSLFVYSFYYFIYNDYTVIFMYMSWYYIIVNIAAIMSMLVNLFRFKELKMCLHKLSMVDDTLEALGTLKEYQRLHNWIVGIIIGWIALSFSLNALDRKCSFHINNLNALIWGAMFRCISCRFQQVNEHFHAVYSNLIENNTDCRGQNKLILVKQMKPEKRKQYMWIIMQVHLQLCLISRELNTVFNVQMSLQMITYFVFSISTWCEIYTIHMNKNAMTTLKHITTILANYFYGILLSIIIFTLNYICQTIYNKINETITTLYKLSNYNLDKDLRELILQFILQIKQREVKFGMGHLYFGYDLIRQFYKSLVTVLMIMIQMNYARPDILLWKF